MNHNPTLQAVREAVLKAKAGPGFEAYPNTKLGLCDVLLAVNTRGRFFYVGMNGILYEDQPYAQPVGKPCIWNLRDDDLSKQSPKTIDFLHSLLT